MNNECLKSSTLLKLEEMHTVNIHIEEDFKGRRWQVCQIVNDPYEPMDCFNEENKVNSQLVLELHKTKGREMDVKLLSI